MVRREPKKGMSYPTSRFSGPISLSQIDQRVQELQIPTQNLAGSRTPRNWREGESVAAKKQRRIWSRSRPPRDDEHLLRGVHSCAYDLRPKQVMASRIDVLMKS
ncbi:hypothetical protein HHI36_020979 [Cryptolaemus montrouzieri]|uniref:Uncharacterized protein n=1 Tax=Cryptolaemus montrouzieri TaxID=559131 RepID=A0ABD2NCP8_9CUCU